ncbi:ABC transporter substrate-binding protein [Peterkaempfera bronchialis]|uniref:ABC transporter substrate-binding protein n=1 Tax=Peterkaempfera bronchialis TaxID=2126346 RepID=UPI003C2CC374
MTSPHGRVRLGAVTTAAAALLGLASCAPQENGNATGSAPTSSDASSDASTAASAGSADPCAKGGLATRTAGTFTVATDNPAYGPWFSDNKPENGKGFESAVAYAVADRLGYGRDRVTWVKVPFNKAFAPGVKDFDVDINQVSISDERRKAVDFSSGYYQVRQAVIALKGSKIADARTIADLKGAKLGAQIGTTSLEVIDSIIKPSVRPAVFDDNDLAKTALKNRQVDGIVIDLPTAFYITGAQVTDAKVVGQFDTAGGRPEQFGLVLDKGSALTPCVTRAVDELRGDGTLAALEKQWLSEAVGAPVLK